MISSLAAVLCLAQPGKSAQDLTRQVPFDLSVAKLPPNYFGVNVDSLTEKLREIEVMKKDTYEKTDAFRKRINERLSTPILGVVPFNSEPTKTLYATSIELNSIYDADSEIYYFQLKAYQSPGTELPLFRPHRGTDSESTLGLANLFVSNWKSFVPDYKRPTEGRVLGRLGQAKKSSTIYAEKSIHGKAYYAVKASQYLIVNPPASKGWLSVVMSQRSVGYILAKDVKVSKQVVRQAVTESSEFAVKSSIKMSPSVAKDNADSLRGLCVFNLVRGVDIVPNFTDVGSKVFNGTSIKVNVKAIWVYNSKTGEIYEKFSTRR